MVRRTPSARLPPRAAALAAALALALSACREAPADVVAAARDALAQQDDAAFLARCEPRAATFLREGSKVQQQSGRMLKVLRDGRPSPALLPKGEIGETIEAGRRALVEVRNGDQRARVPLRLVRGQWRLDLLESDVLLAALRPTGR